jgi:hypothetical protein
MPELDTPPPVAIKPKASHKFFRRLIKFLTIVVIIVVVLAIGWFVWGKSYRFNLIVGKGYQAVFLTNGQVYFGKLQASDGWVTLRDVYYLQVTPELQPASSGSTVPVTPTENQNQQTSTTPASSASAPKSANNRLQLVKFGAELHGPEDVMYIAKDKILFWENMKSDSQVMQAIKDYQAKQ